MQRLEAVRLLANASAETMKNTPVWHDAAAAVSPKVLSWMLDISQAGSLFLFQNHRSNYLLVKVMFLSMALEISLSVRGSLCHFYESLISNEQNGYCTSFCSTADKLFHGDNHSLTEYAITMMKWARMRSTTLVYCFDNATERDFVNTYNIIVITWHSCSRLLGYLWPVTFGAKESGCGFMILKLHSCWYISSKCVWM